MLNDIIPMIPPSRVYVEPFGGGASILLNKPRAEIEVYNDLDDALVNLFQVVRDEEMFARFADVLQWTPSSRREFERAIKLHGDAAESAVKRAAMFYTMLNQSISGKRLASPGDWGRSRNDNFSDRWYLRQAKLGWIHARMKGVVLECRDALDVLQEWDGDDTVFYCDPPYVLETRNQRKYYAVEPGDDYHEQLVDVLLAVRGMVVLSGYNHPVYDKLVKNGWHVDLFGTNAMMDTASGHGSKGKRVEMIYRNVRAAERASMRPLFILDAEGKMQG